MAGAKITADKSERVSVTQVNSTHPNYSTDNRNIISPSALHRGQGRKLEEEDTR